jgi:sugar phosphate isomerase/epimerase
MRLEIFRTLWGYRGSWQQALDEALGAGFDGIEARIPETATQRAINARLLREQNVPYIATLFTSRPASVTTRARKCRTPARRNTPRCWPSTNVTGKASGAARKNVACRPPP